MNIWTVISLGLVSLSSTQAALSTENFNGCSGNSLCAPELLSEAKLARVVPPVVSPPSNCSAIGCLVELCPDGSVPPTPPGRCCPSGLLCPRDCGTEGDCRVYHCRDGSVAPVPPGHCCPDPHLCHDSLSLTCSQEECLGPALCPNGDLAPVAPGHCCPDPRLCPMADCDAKACIPEVCDDGSLAPIPRSECCPRTSQCSVTDCGQVRCLLERCSDGSIAPPPPGGCCPSLTQCHLRYQPGQEISSNYLSQEEPDCQGKQCISVLCHDGKLAPVPPGTCCPNQALCPPPPPPPPPPTSPPPPAGPGAQCEDVACFKFICPDGSPAPVPPGQCCPAREQCLDFRARDWER